MQSFPQFDSLPPKNIVNSTQSLFSLSLQQLEEIIETLGLERYRSQQLWHALYQQRVSSFEEMTALPKSMREALARSGFQVGMPRIAQAFVSGDGTERYLVACVDGETVETVWMPNGDDGELGDGSDAAIEEADAASMSDGKTADPALPYRRATICISSQVGCAVNCQFCLTAKLGVKRNLTAGEIAGQVAAVLNRHQVRVGRDRINLVFMGMGEPFLNYDNFMAAVHLLVEGMGIPESRMTVSTSGILPGIERFAKEKLRPKLALSLNAPNNSIRESIMPVTRKWKIEDLLAALREVPLRPRERMTFEYVLLGGVNDAVRDARELSALLQRSGLPAKVNLIVWNPGPDIPYRMPKLEDVAAFQQHLISSGVPAFLRRPRGRDIYAACGQLKRTVE
ncbi:MAG TPA: 23S rRNA (adenine(2503)-C(2))-methyltransferase RlmN [Acidobacteriaceae bacterium]|nr:23S rRNA (adenine(2503)-C(2))-methyltransferase RlmN [Acidobacteriaceae bacterium]